MAIDFPTSPTVGQQYTFNGVTYTYTAQGAWVYSTSAGAAFAPINSPTFTGDPRAPTPSPADNDTSLATTAFVAAALSAGSAFPAGTLMLFQQTSAPTGWVKQTTHDNKALRVVSGTASSGGVQPFSTVFAKTSTDAYTLSVSEIPVHGHPITQLSTYCAYAMDAHAGSNWTGGGAGSMSSTVQYMSAANNGSGGSHPHGMDIRVMYVDLIIAAKS